MALRIRRGTDAERQLILPEPGELIYTTDTKLVYVGDGNTQGGNPISVGAALLEVVNDLSPELGGDLVLNGFDITGTGNISVSGNITANDLTVDTLASNTVVGILLNNDIDLNTNSIIGTGVVDITGTISATEVSTDTLSSDSTSTILLGDLLDLNGNNIVGVGNINIDGTITATGNINLGDTSGDNITVAGQISSNLIPDADLTYDIGSPLLSWQAGYFADIESTGTVTANDLVTTRIVANDNSVVYDDALSTIAIDVINAGTVSATEFNGDLTGSVFGDNAAVFFDASNNTVTANSGNIPLLQANDVSSGIGVVTVGNTQRSRFEVLYEGTDATVKLNSIAANQSRLDFRVANGTLDVPTSVVLNDQVGGIGFRAHNGTSYTNVGSILTFIDPDGVIGANRSSGTLTFINTNVTANGVVIAEFDTHGVFKAPVLSTTAYADTTARDNLTGLQAGNIVLVNDDGTGSTQFQGYDGTEWKTLGPNDETTNIVSATSAFTLSLSDSYKYHRVSNASAVTVTVPPNSSVAFPIGTNLTVVQAGVGQVTFAAGVGVTVNSADGFLSTRVQYSSATLTKVGTDEWDLAGDLGLASTETITVTDFSGETDTTSGVTQQ